MTREKGGEGVIMSVDEVAGGIVPPPPCRVGGNDPGRLRRHGERGLSQRLQKSSRRREARTLRSRRPKARIFGAGFEETGWGILRSGVRMRPWF